MQLKIKIECNNKKRLLQELKYMIKEVEIELFNPICKGCKSCKDMKKGCIAGGGGSGYNPRLESTWSLRRKYVEHKKICKSKQKL